MARQSAFFVLSRERKRDLAVAPGNKPFGRGKTRTPPVSTAAGKGLFRRAAYVDIAEQGLYRTSVFLRKRKGVDQARCACGLRRPRPRRLHLVKRQKRGVARRKDARKRRGKRRGGFRIPHEQRVQIGTEQRLQQRIELFGRAHFMRKRAQGDGKLLAMVEHPRKRRIRGHVRAFDLFERLGLSGHAGRLRARLVERSTRRRCRVKRLGHCRTSALVRFFQSVRAFCGSGRLGAQRVRFLKCALQLNFQLFAVACYELLVRHAVRKRLLRLSAALADRVDFRPQLLLGMAGRRERIRQLAR